jgi:hypothetical protein
VPTRPATLCCFGSQAGYRQAFRTGEPLSHGIGDLPLKETPTHTWSLRLESVNHPAASGCRIGGRGNQVNPHPLPNLNPGSCGAGRARVPAPREQSKAREEWGEVTAAHYQPLAPVPTRAIIPSLCSGPAPALIIPLPLPGPKVREPGFALKSPCMHPATILGWAVAGFHRALSSDSHTLWPGGCHAFWWGEEVVMLGPGAWEGDTTLVLQWNSWDP